MNAHTRHISRELAAQKLNVSIRTIDRYIRRGFLEVKRLDRHVFITEPSFQSYYQDQIERGVVSETESPVETQAAGEGSVETVGEAVERIEVSEQDTSELGSGFQMGERRETPRGTRHAHAYDLQPAIIYKELYEQVKEKHDEQVKRLEGAHYRVGQLEAQLKNMVPLLEYRKEQKRLATLDQQYQEDIRHAKVRVIETRRLADSERLNKNIYIALVYGMLALQPVFWVLLQG